GFAVQVANAFGCYFTFAPDPCRIRPEPYPANAASSPCGESPMADKKRKQPSAPKESPAKAPELAVVGMGASAGGLDAFKKFFDAMPADSGLAFVLIQHLDPTHESMMVELLAKHTAMPVAEVNNQMPIQANHVYIA